MYTKYALVAILVCSVLHYSGADFPNDPKPCKFGDGDCLVKVINYYLHEKKQGDSSIGLLSIDPLDTGTFTVKQGADSPVNMELKFMNNKLFGIGDASAYKARGFGKDLTKKHELRFKIPSFSLVGEYSVEGRVLVLPISGSGKNDLTLIDNDIILQWVGVPLEKDGATYMKTDKMRVTLKPNKFNFKLDNLFNGDKALSENMNLFLNENAKEIYQEIGVTYSKELAKMFSNIIDKVFAKTPYDKMFVE